MKTNSPLPLPQSPLPQSIILALFAASLVGLSGAHAATFDWTGATDVTWSTGSNWNGTNPPPANDLTSDIARFYGASYTNQPTVNAARQVAGLVFGNSTAAVNFTTQTNQGRLSLGGLGLLMEATSGAVSIGLSGNQGVNLGADQTWTNNSSSLLTVYRVDNLTNTTPYILTIAGSGSGGMDLRQVANNNNTPSSPGTVSLIINTSGAGVTTLSGQNTFTGDTTLTAGVLALGHANSLINSSLNTAGTGTITTNATTLAFGGLKGSRNLSSVITSGYSSVTALTLNPFSGTSTYTGIIANGSGNTSLTKTGAGTQVLEAANTYTGATNINAGVLAVTSLGNASTDSTLGAAAATSSNLAFNGGTLQLMGATTVAQSTDRLFHLNVNGGTLDSSAGAGSSMNFTNAGTITAQNSVGHRTLTLTGARNGSISSIIGQRNTGDSTTSVLKTGNGTWTLGGANTYTGSTTITGGTLLINGSVGVGGVTVANGGTLGGSGTVSGLVTVNDGGTLSPGNSPGIATYSAGLLMETGSNFTFELLDDTTAGRGTNYDGVNVTGGTLTIQSDVIFNVIFNGDGSSTNFADAFWDTDQSWLVFDNTDAPSVTSPIYTLGTVSNDTLGNAFSSTGGALGFSQIGNDVYLTYTIPEPSSAFLFSAGLTCMLVMQRRRRH